MTALDSRIGFLAPPYARTENALQRLLRRLEAAEPTGYAHALAVETLSVEAARLLSVGKPLLGALRLGAFLHDVGKLEIPDSILRKSGPLDSSEWASMREHPAIGMRILSPIIRSEETLSIVLLHHERWDGTGYPRRLAGADTPLTARIVAVADAFQAMIEPRPYRPPLTCDEALRELRANAGWQFDPECVGAVCEAVARRDPHDL